MLLHLTSHPLVFFVEHVLNSLPVSISNLYEWVGMLRFMHISHILSNLV